jgi:two-component system, response regulator PdtaR
VIFLGDGMLVVCSQHELAEQLLSIISSVLAGVHSTAASGAQARRMTSLTEYAAVLIAGRLPDETASDLAIGLAENGVKRLVIVIDRANLADAHEMLDGTGVTILSKPLTKDALSQAMKLIVKVGYGEGGIFEKAKLMLMQQKNWTEPQAHKYIQKLSMDKRLPRDVTSQYVIRALEREKNGQA